MAPGFESKREMPRRRLGGMLRGAAWAGCPGWMLLLIVELGAPQFVDAPILLWALCCGLPGVVGAVVGAAFPISVRRVDAGVWLMGMAVVVGLSVESRPALDEAKLLVLGIDGATWEVVDRHTDKLPHLAQLRSEASWGVLPAEPPLFSPLLWTTLATGKPTAEHGVRGFRVHGGDCQVPRFFDVAEHFDLKVGVHKWLVTSPPRPVNGFMVPGWLADDARTEPVELAPIKELELAFRERPGTVSRSLPLVVWDLVRLGVRGSTVVRGAQALLSSGRSGYARRQLVRADIDRDVFVASMGRTKADLGVLVLYATDALSHRHWNEPEMLAAYEQADATLGELLDRLPKDGRLVVLSDHGFTSGVDGRWVLSPGPMADLLGEVAEVFAEGTRVVVDVDPNEALRDAGISSAFFVETLPGELWAVSLREEMEPPTGWAHKDRSQRGLHHPNGIFAAIGPGVVAGEVIISPLDVAPVLLAGVGLPAGQDMSGRVPDGLWSETTRVLSHDHLQGEFEWPDAPAAGFNEERLRALGYLAP
jgi:hypothetical protein